MNKTLLTTLAATVVATALPVAAFADDHHEMHRHYTWHRGMPDRDAWYYSPHWSGRRYVVAPVPAPAIVPQPYYYAVAPQPTPVYVEPQPALSITLGR